MMIRFSKEKRLRSKQALFKFQNTHQKRSGSGVSIFQESRLIYVKHLSNFKTVPQLDNSSAIGNTHQVSREEQNQISIRTEKTFLIYLLLNALDLDNKCCRLV